VRAAWCLPGAYSASWHPAPDVCPASKAACISDKALSGGTDLVAAWAAARARAARRGPAGTACGHWTGVLLSDVLTYCGAGDAARKARHVCFRGPKHELPQGAPPAAPRPPQLPAHGLARGRRFLSSAYKRICTGDVSECGYASEVCLHAGSRYMRPHCDLIRCRARRRAWQLCMAACCRDQLQAGKGCRAARREGRELWHEHACAQGHGPGQRCDLGV